MNRIDARVRAALRDDVADREPWWRINNAATDGPTEILIYGEIGWSFWDDSVTAIDFVNELREIDTDRIDVRINSPGGDVFDGIAIMNALRAHKAKVTTYIDGIAASAASFIAMAGDDVVIRRNAEMMIHDAWGVSVGNAEDMREMSTRLDQISDNIASMYADKAGGGVAKWRTAMKTETWYSDKEALDAGLVDRIDKGTATQAAKNRFDLSIFNFAGRRAAPEPPRIAAMTTSAERVEETDEEKEHKVSTLSEGLRERLGADPEATEEQLLELALEQLDAEPAAGTDTAAAAKLPDGAVIVDQARLESLEARAARGDLAMQRQEQEDRDEIIRAAVRAGKIPAARADHWNALLAKDAGIKDVLDTMPAGSAVPVGEVGHGQDGSRGAEHVSASAQLDEITNSDVYTNWSM
ncbi:head maturation protease, ClpP-related [Rhodococcoides corynebacterioides]|uniref:head maturation protease, ClpP-related n=1 Tax=Rhodococcoides corynebacterioides TaxID=53972 RepID=UPI003F7EA5FF